MDILSNKHVNEQIKGICKIPKDVGKHGRLIARLIFFCLQCDLAAPPKVSFSPPFDSGLAFKLFWPVEHVWQK